MAHIGQNTGNTNLSASPVDLTGVDFLKDANFILKKIIQTELENKCKLICKNDQKWSNM